MKMLNVRLNSSDEQVVRTLRDQGVVVSDFVREALRQEAARRKPLKPRSKKEADAILKKIYAEFPIGPEEQALIDQVPSTLDKSAFRKYVAQRVMRGIPH